MNELIRTIWQSADNRRLIDFQMCGISYPDRHYAIRRPHSSIACIEYVQSGRGVIHADDRAYKVSAGDAYFLQPGQDHYYHADPNEPWQKIFVNLSGPLLDCLTDGYRLNNRCYYHGLNIEKELTDILSLALNPENDCTADLVCCITRIFQKMHEHLTDTEQCDNIADRIREHLDRTAAGRFSFAELCAQVSLSQSHCIRLFRQAYGLTPYAYFLAKKIALAKDLLVNTNLPVKAIAHNLSFADEYYFSNVFKQKTGMSPRAYRTAIHNTPETCDQL